MSHVCQLCSSDDVRDYVAHEGASFLRCHNCGLVFNGQPEEVVRSAHQVFDEAESFARVERRFGRKMKTARRRIGLIRSYRSTGSLLDIGCGTCAILIAAREAGYEAVGLDDGEYPVRRGRELGFEVRQASLTDTGFEDGAFDVVTLWNVLEHIPRTADGLAEIHRILKPGGIVALTVPNGEYLKAHLLRGRHRYYRGAGARLHHVYHTPRTIRRALENQGFEVRTTYCAPGSAIPCGPGPRLCQALVAPLRRAVNLLADALRVRDNVLVLASKAHPACPAPPSGRPAPEA